MKVHRQIINSAQGSAQGTVPCVQWCASLPVQLNKNYWRINQNGIEKSMPLQWGNMESAQGTVPLVGALRHRDVRLRRVMYSLAGMWYFAIGIAKWYTPWGVLCFVLFQLFFHSEAASYRLCRCFIFHTPQVCFIIKNDGIRLLSLPSFFSPQSFQYFWKEDWCTKLPQDTPKYK